MLKAKKAARSVVIRAIERGYKKQSSSFDILGIEVEGFKKHFEDQFERGMKWANHGDWHIDHITPLSWAKNKKEILKLTHYTNLQPLWRSDNLITGNRYAG